VSAPFTVPQNYSVASSVQVGSVVDFGATYDQDRTNYEQYWNDQLTSMRWPGTIIAATSLA
jgi:hypothetical protein